MHIKHTSKCGCSLNAHSENTPVVFSSLPEYPKRVFFSGFLQHHTHQHKARSAQHPLQHRQQHAVCRGSMLQFAVGFVITPRHLPPRLRLLLVSSSKRKQPEQKQGIKRMPKTRVHSTLCKVPSRSQPTLTTQELQFYS